MGFTLTTEKRYDEAIPFLEKAIVLNPKSAASYNLLANIYEDKDQTDRALAYYKQGIKVVPENQKLHVNMALFYYRLGMFDESEGQAIDAIKLNPNNASSHRVYALATYRLKKRGVSLLAWCNFLLLEPDTKRTGEAYNNIMRILNYGIKKTDDKHISVQVSSDESASGNFALPMAVLAATADKKGLSATDSLTLQLTEVFKVSSGFDGTNRQKFYTHCFSDYFRKLAASNNMPAFARYVSLSAYKKENLAWFEQHDKELTELEKWAKETQRNFE